MARNKNFISQSTNEAASTSIDGGQFFGFQWQIPLKSGGSGDIALEKRKDEGGVRAVLWKLFASR